MSLTEPSESLMESTFVLWTNQTYDVLIQRRLGYVMKYLRVAELRSFCFKKYSELQSTRLMTLSIFWAFVYGRIKSMMFESKEILVI